MFYKSPRVNLGRLTPLLQDLKGQIEFLEKTEILPTKQTCTDCDQVLTKRSNKGYFVYYRCTKCSKRISARSGTILSGSKLSFRRFILMVYSFCQFNWTCGQTQQEVCVTSDGEEGEDSESSTQLSSRSINKYFKQRLEAQVVRWKSMRANSAKESRMAVQYLAEDLPGYLEECAEKQGKCF